MQNQLKYTPMLSNHGKKKHVISKRCADRNLDTATYVAPCCLVWLEILDKPRSLLFLSSEKTGYIAGILNQQEV